MPVNTVPERLVAFRVYRDGSSDLKGVADIQLPSFEMLRDTVRGAGIAGEYESPTLGQFQSMKLALNWHTITKEQLRLLAQHAHRLDCRGAFQEYDAAAGAYIMRQTRVVVQGPPMTVDPGKFEANATTGGSTQIEALYLKVDIDGENCIEIDKLNYKCVIFGVDYLAGVRAALGL